jgi:hypothetical protein
MANFVPLSVLSPRRRLYEPEAAGFRLRPTGVRLLVPLCGDRKPLCGLDQNKNCSFLNWTPIVFILDLWMDTIYNFASDCKVSVCTECFIVQFL